MLFSFYSKGWELLHARRWSRRYLTLYKIINNLLSKYISESIPKLSQYNYAFRNQPIIGQFGQELKNLMQDFFLIACMNGVHLTLILESFIYLFKSKLFSLTGTISNSVFGIYENHKLSLSTQLRVGLSNLNLQKFKNNFNTIHTFLFQIT